MPKGLDTIDSGSNYSFTEKLLPPGSEIAKSAFNLSHLHTTTINNCGELVPIGLIETVPGDSFDINVNSLVRVLPQVVPLYSRQRLYIHAFYSRNGDLWKNWHTFMTKGYSGRVTKSIPSFISKDAFATHGTCGVNGKNPIKSDSLAAYLGLPFIYPVTDKDGNFTGNFSNITYEMFKQTATTISLLPFMMYQRIYKDYYMNPNYYIGNENWFPDNDEDFRLDDNGKVISNTGQVQDDHTIPGVDYSTLQVDLFAKRYRDYANDYFTSAVPYPQRGDTPQLSSKIEIDAKDIAIQALSGGTFTAGDPASPNPVYNLLFPGFNNSATQGTASLSFSRGDNLGVIHQTGTTYEDLSSDHLFGITKETLKSTFDKANTTITLNQLRELAIAQIELEKMARTDGSYREFGLTFFNKVSKNSVDHRPVYIGGAYQSLVFSEVLQTSQTNTQEGNQSVLGSYAGHGISASQDGYIGHIECDDYGYIMIIASIMPDVYYHQGISKMWTRYSQEDFYLPQRARMGLTGIANRELMWTYSEHQAGEHIFRGLDNLGLFAYQTPYDELRYCSNRISGKIADPNEKSFYPYTQARTFSTRPKYNQEFAQANKVRKDYLAGDQSEVAYTAQFSLGIRAVRPIPYNPEPAQILN